LRRLKDDTDNQERRTRREKISFHVHFTGNNAHTSFGSSFSA
jgi:hypothetical protein